MTQNVRLLRMIALQDSSYFLLCQHNRKTRTLYIQGVLALVAVWNVPHIEQCRFICILFHLLFPLIHYIPLTIVLSRLQYSTSVFTCTSADRDQWTELTATPTRIPNYQEVLYFLEHDRSYILKANMIIKMKANSG
jgi:hypothetical protein